MIEPKILYFGTPVVLLSTINPDGTPNLAPMSSAWFLRQACVLGMTEESRTVQNMKRQGEVAINLPSPSQAQSVDRLAFLTGNDPVPEHLQQMGYAASSRKFEVAGLTPMPSDLIAPPRARECPVHLEGAVRHIRPFGDEQSVCVEIEILRVHAEEDILVPGKHNYVDPFRWSPLINNFLDFFGLSEQSVSPSRVAVIYNAMPNS